jgi:hypothetical protein
MQRWLVEFLFLLIPSLSQAMEPATAPGGLMVQALRLLLHPLAGGRSGPITGTVTDLEGHPLGGLAPGQGAEILALRKEANTTTYSRAWCEADRCTVALEPGAWEVRGFLYDAASQLERSVRWTIDIPAGTVEKEIDLDLNTAVSP